jgi:hypothetical protein
MKINYISHLNSAMEKMAGDGSLNPNHISLYMAIFTEWNCQRFAKDFHIDRTSMMDAAKIGSRTTYYKCLRELDAADYPEYIPSRSIYRGSKIKMTVMGSTLEHNNTADEPDQIHVKTNTGSTNGQDPVGVISKNGQGVDVAVPKNGQGVVQNINNNKQKNIIETKLPEGRQAVIDLFVLKGFDAGEGKKFYTYYKNREWRTGNNEPVRNWHSLALNWMDRVELQGLDQGRSTVTSFKNHLKTPKIKDYAKPL